MLLAVGAAWSPTRGAVAVAVLHWTATGDDGSIGTATRYDVRRSTIPITSANFPLADTVGKPPAPLPAGSQQTCDVMLPSAGVTYYFAIRAVDDAGNWSLISNVLAMVAPSTATRKTAPVEAAFAPPWPNPTRVQVQFGLAIPEESWTEVDVFDATGRRLRRLWSGTLAAGPKQFEWNLLDDRGQRVEPGVYFGRVRIGNWTRTRRLVVIG
jgi:hypothetical protein